MAASPMPPSTRRIVRRESQEAPIHAPSTAPTATAPASGAKAVQVHRQALDSGREPETCPVGAAF